MPARKCLGTRGQFPAPPHLFSFAICRRQTTGRVKTPGFPGVKTVKFKCIEASVRELGLIEPLVVFPAPKAEGQFLLLDGHVRLTGVGIAVWSSSTRSTA